MKKKLGKISIIMPVYNAEKYLPDVLRNLTEQTYTNLQIIVVDDGSTDKSRDIIESFMQKDKRVCLIASENRGPSSARNIGLEHTDGEYIRFIDADDSLPEDSMEKLIAPYIENQEIDLVIGNYKCIEEKNFYTGESSKKGKKSEKEFAEMFVKHVKSFYYGVPWNKLYKRDIIERYQIRFDENLIWCEDFLFNLEYYKHSKYVYVVHDEKGVYEYCIRDTGITENLSEWSKEELRRIDDLRFESARVYFSKYGLDDFCCLEWKYSGLYYKLSNIVHKQNGKTLQERYKEFYLLLSNKDVFRYIIFMEEDSGLAMWKLLKSTVKNRHYRFTFGLFVMKEYIAECVNSRIPFFRKIIKDKIPKFL